MIEDTETALRRAGDEGYELFVLWTGVKEDVRFRVHHIHVPAQDSYRTEDGLLVHVDGQALHKLNVWLFEHGEQLAAQVHAHPTEAFHSETDDAFPIASQLGSLSLVAADFCSRGLLDPTSAAYRLGPDGWGEVPTLQSVIEVVD